MTKDKDIKTVVPALRFPEFRDAEGWNKTTLKSISERLTKKVGNLKLPPVSISAGIGFVTQTEKFGRDISGEQYKNYIVLNYGDFAYNKGNSKKYPQGCICKLTEFTCVAAPNAFLCFRFNANVVADFYKGYFDNNYHGKQLQQHITSGARSDGLLNINPNDFFGIILPTPRLLKEQQMIADCLGSLDDLINAVADKIEALKEHKKGLMQQLFPADGKTTPALRFPEFQNAGEWELVPVGKCDIETFTGYAFKGNDILEDNDGTPLMRGINITEGTVRHNNDIDRFYIGDDSKLSKYKLICNDLVIAMDGSKVGRNFALLRKQDEGALLVQRVARLRSNNSDFIMFIYQQVSSERFKTYVDRINTSSGIPHISMKQIEDFEVWTTPNVIEFKMVTNCLSSIDDLISAEIDKLDQLKVHKKGLMQQLFPTINE